MRKTCIIIALSICSWLHAGDYCFIDKEHPWHFSSWTRIVAKAKLRTEPVKGKHLHFGEAGASEYYSHFLDPKNCLSWQLGYSFLHLGWNNPRFNKEDFHYAIASVAWISHLFSKWRMVTDVGVTVDAESFNFGKTAVCYGLLWGRYSLNKRVGAHVGAIAYGGFGTGYALPILGMDAHFKKKWHFTAVFPIDISLKYDFNRSWSASLVYSGFGGPYKYPRRALGGHGRYQNAIFKVFATGADLNIRYQWLNRFSALLGGGYNFGGWILIEDAHQHHPKYYKFDSAPYLQALITFSL